MYPPIFSVCSANSGVTAVLGSSPCRLYPFGEAPDNIAAPYAVWQTISGSSENYLGNSPDADNFVIQVDVYADSASAARAAALALRNAIESSAYVLAWNGETRDPDTNRYRYSFDVSWIVQR